MENPSLTPAIIIAVAMIVSSLILCYSMSKLGGDVVAAGIHSRKISLDNTHNTGPFRVVVEGSLQSHVAPQSE
ncbi:hypothetical protein NG895_03250 [Aeoliella sp. ICT_H6.2]|uniref:Uncharacterized protein n=1 Tax=Aeoliella straminimaris TaxID=2954799 RepID=A0A9X2FF37_9BACT|nr:hypothetical protein [Aeoliella straminimaris]MCO6042916.1 hypothetical protein [Aeoliella straminimaris]